MVQAHCRRPLLDASVTTLVTDKTISPQCTTFCASCELGVCSMMINRAVCTDPRKCKICSPPGGCGALSTIVKPPVAAKPLGPLALPPVTAKLLGPVAYRPFRVS